MTPNIYIPGLGYTNSESREVDKAVNEYDERLYFQQNVDTQQWCIYMKMPHGEAPVPILGFEEIPSPEAALKKLYQSDTMRHGEKILEDMNKKNTDLMIPYDKAVDTANGQMAEAFEWAYRKMGSDKVRYVKSYRPIKKK